MLSTEKTILIMFLIKERLSDIDELIKLSDESDTIELQTEQKILNEICEEFNVFLAKE